MFSDSAGSSIDGGNMPLITGPSSRSKSAESQLRHGAGCGSKAHTPIAIPIIHRRIFSRACRVVSSPSNSDVRALGLVSN
jgi:hypothetical protein